MKTYFLELTFEDSASRTELDERPSFECLDLLTQLQGIRSVSLTRRPAEYHATMAKFKALVEASGDTEETDMLVQAAEECIVQEFWFEASD